MHLNYITSTRGVEHCKQMGELDMSSNELDNLDGIAGVFNCCRIDLHNNNLRTVADLSRCVNLRSLNLNQNDLGPNVEHGIMALVAIPAMKTFTYEKNAGLNREAQTRIQKHFRRHRRNCKVSPNPLRSGGGGGCCELS